MVPKDLSVTNLVSTKSCRKAALAWAIRSLMYSLNCFSHLRSELEYLKFKKRVNFCNFKCLLQVIPSPCLCTVPNNSYRFWADLVLRGLFLGYGWHPWILVQNAMPPLYITQIFIMRSSPWKSGKYTRGAWHFGSIFMDVSHTPEISL